ncbi:MAG TPA: RsmD family RNA methyltransferase, partial [Oscillatoriaceae cyanobacterium]
AIPRLSGKTFDVIFLDPPYALDPTPVVAAIAQAGLLAQDGRLVVEHRRDRALPENIDAFRRLKTSHYSESCLTLYRRSENEAPAPD